MEMKHRLATLGFSLIIAAPAGLSAAAPMLSAGPRLMTLDPAKRCSALIDQANKVLARNADVGRGGMSCKESIDVQARAVWRLDLHLRKEGGDEVDLWYKLRALRSNDGFSVEVCDATLCGPIVPAADASAMPPTVVGFHKVVPELARAFDGMARVTPRRGLPINGLAPVRFFATLTASAGVTMPLTGSGKVTMKLVPDTRLTPERGSAVIVGAMPDALASCLRCEGAECGRRELEYAVIGRFLQLTSRVAERSEMKPGEVFATTYGATWWFKGIEAKNQVWEYTCGVQAEQTAKLDVPSKGMEVP